MLRRVSHYKLAILCCLFLAVAACSRGSEAVAGEDLASGDQGVDAVGLAVPAVLAARSFDFDHVDALWAHCSALVSPHGFHGPASNQCGAACNWAQNYTTDEYAHGLEHPLSLLGAVAGFLRRPA